MKTLLTPFGALFLMVAMMFVSCSGEKAHPVPKVADEYQLPGPVSRTDSEGKTFTLSGYPFTHYISNGGKTPLPGDRVKYHETIYQNDSVIYSTKLMNRPIVSVLPTMSTLPTPIPPDYEGLLIMSVGDSLSVFQDLDTFNVASLPKGVSNEDDFIYHLTLESIEPKAQVDIELAKFKAREGSVKDSIDQLITAFETGTLDNQLQTHESGVRYLIYEEGTGRSAENGNFIKVNYSGFLRDRSNFDNTFKDAQPFTFRLGRGRVIQGWDIGVELLAVGGKGVFFIPYQLGYGLAGKPPNIPEKADLVFYIEVLDVY